MEIGERNICPLNLKIGEWEIKIGERKICSLERKEGVKSINVKEWSAKLIHDYKSMINRFIMTFLKFY